MTRTFGSILEDARKLGAEHGRAAGSWVIDGNTSRETARAILDGWEDCDPQIMDMMPAPLSGEWADSMTPARLLYELTDGVGEYVHTDDELHDAACAAYEESFEDAYWLEVRASAESVVQ
jgi:hypothetical protein